jgi:peptidase M28-like protein
MKPRLRRSLTILAVLLLVAIANGQEAAPQNDTISKDALRADLFFLASDSMRGRLTDTPENRLAAEWIKSRFERIALEPVVGQSYYQPYNLMTATLAEPNALEVLRSDGSSVRLRAGQDFYPQRFTASGHAKAAVVFAGFGIVSKDLGYDDYRGDVSGRIVLVIDHEPGERDANSPFDGVVTAEAANVVRKTLAAQEKGAIGILFVSDVHNHPGQTNFEGAAQNYWPKEPPRVDRYTLASMMERVRIPAAQIAPALAAAIVAGSGRTLEDLSRAAESAHGSVPVPLTGVQVDLTTSVDRHVVPDRNVLGLIRGADPKLKDEWVIVCAHYDHDGADGPRIFNGADDDGSGTVGLLAIAEAYAAAARAGQRPKRSVLFAAWNSEERGLLGAWAFTESPLVPLSRVAAVLNMDMIGRNEEVQTGGGNRFNGLELQTSESNRNAVNVIGTTRSADMRAETEKANRGIGLDLRFRYDNNVSNLMRRSDHWPFLQHGVPSLWFHTGLHPDYHTQYDRPEKINYDKMEKVARLVHQMSWNIANADARPKMSARPPTTQER